MIETSPETRLAREREHFDRVYAEEEKSEDLRLTDADKRRYANPPADTIFSKEYYFHLLSPQREKRILEIACGNGVDACLAAHLGAHVFAYDVSPAAIDLTRKRAEQNGLADRVHLQVCGDIEQAFAGEQFDAVMGFAALHHLNLNGLADRIRGRLKPGGVAVFAEPVVNSKTLDFVRRMIPYRPVEITEDEQPLNDRAIMELAKPFSRIRRREFECVSRVYPLFSRYSKLVSAAFWIDSWLMRVKPLRRFASVVVFALDY
jgi:2-polyprenyl-3-methyl-5-hydroxy-6-metoxy-1,4-benzoquinol methylase